jgi:cellobiose-specific phosphotransferase system component IIA
VSVRSKKNKYIDTVNRNTEQCITYLNRDRPELWAGWIWDFIKLSQKDTIMDIGASFDYGEEIALFLASKLGIRQDNKYQYRYYEKKKMEEIINTINRRLQEEHKKQLVNLEQDKAYVEAKLDYLVFHVQNHMTEFYPPFLAEWIKMNPKQNNLIKLNFIKEKLGIEPKDNQFNKLLVTLYRRLTAYD